MSFELLLVLVSSFRQLPLMFSASAAQVGPAVLGGIEQTATAAKFDKSDEVLFKAQDEFLRRLKVSISYTDVNEGARWVDARGQGCH